MNDSPASPRKSRLAALGSLAWLLAAVAAPLGHAAERPKQIVLVAGPADGHPKGTHEYAATVRLLGECLEASANVQKANPGGIAVRVCPLWPEEESVLDSADTIVLVTSGSDRVETNHPLLIEGRMEQVEKQMARGCGLAAIHYSTFVAQSGRRKNARLDRRLFRLSKRTGGQRLVFQDSALAGRSEADRR